MLIRPEDVITTSIFTTFFFTLFLQRGNIQLANGLKFFYYIFHSVEPEIAQFSASNDEKSIYFLKVDVQVLQIESFDEFIIYHKQFI